MQSKPEFLIGFRASPIDEFICSRFLYIPALPFFPLVTSRFYRLIAAPEIGYRPVSWAVPWWVSSEFSVARNCGTSILQTNVKTLESFTFSNSNGKLDFSDGYLMERPKETVNSRWMFNTGFSSESDGISKIRNYRNDEK